jgi:hypothetical protein
VLMAGRTSTAGNRLEGVAIWSMALVLGALAASGASRALAGLRGPAVLAAVALSLFVGGVVAAAVVTAADTLRIGKRSVATTTEENAAS